jgi:hypothetical protein
MIKTEHNDIVGHSEPYDYESAVMAESLRSFVSSSQIEALEKEILSIGTISVPVKHVIGGGIYARQITMPKGTLAIGHAHSDECINIVTAGSVSVVIDGRVVVVKAPAMFTSAPLDRKVGYVHEDVTWITVHSTIDTDIAKIESKILVKSKAFNEHEKKRMLTDSGMVACSDSDIMAARIDYASAIHELGFTNDQVVSISENVDDVVPMPSGRGSSVYTATSSIQGIGVFSAFQFGAGVSLCVARMSGFRTPAGRFTNHSHNPNCEFVHDGYGDVNLVTTRPVSIGEELTVNYRHAFSTARSADMALNNLNTK